MRCLKTIILALVSILMLMSCEFDSKNKSTTEPTANINKSNKKDADFEYRAAVMDFRPNGDLTNKDVEGISLIFATYFHPEGYTMIERSQIETVLKEQGIQKSQITEQQMVDIGKIMNLSYIVIGDVTLHMDEYNVDVRLVSVEKGKIIASEGATLSRNEGTYRQYLGKIANNLSAKVPTKPVVKTVIKKETEGKKFDDVIVLYDYFKVFPNDLGYFDAQPNTIIDKINEAEQYGYCTWRIPTKEELSLLRSNNIIPPDIDYIASYSSTYSGRVRLVTDEEPCMEYKARKIEEEQKRLAALKVKGFVDLGLPSGTLWKDKNEDGGFYTYDQAISMFGNKLPTKEQIEELMNSCQWTWNGNGCKIVGPSDNSIVLPAGGYLTNIGRLTGEGSYGSYWSSTPYSSENAWFLDFNSGVVNMFNDNRSIRLSVRLVSPSE